MIISIIFHVHNNSFLLVGRPKLSWHVVTCKKKYAHKKHMGILCSSEDARNCGDMQITCATSCRARETSEAFKSPTISSFRARQMSESVVYMQKISRAQTTISSFCARRTSETVVTCKFFMEQPFPHFVLVGRLKLRWHADFSWSNPFLISCSSDVRNCGVHAKNFTRTNNNFVILCSSDVRNCGDMQIFHGATLSSLRARRTSETAVTCRFFMEQPFPHFVFVGRPKLRWHANFSWSNPFLISCSSDVRNCGAMRIFLVQEQPFRCFVLVRRPTCKFWTCMHSSFCAHRTFETVVTFKFFTWGVNRFIVLCSWDVRNFGEMHKFFKCASNHAFCHVVLVGRPKLRRDAKNSLAALFFRVLLNCEKKV